MKKMILSLLVAGMLTIGTSAVMAAPMHGGGGMPPGHGNMHNPPGRHGGSMHRPPQPIPHRVHHHPVRPYRYVNYVNYVTPPPPVPVYYSQPYYSYYNWGYYPSRILTIRTGNFMLSI